jgi:hypothetical protein
VIIFRGRMRSQTAQDNNSKKLILSPDIRKRIPNYCRAT